MRPGKSLKQARDTYFEKPKRTRTWSGLDLRPFYRRGKTEGNGALPDPGSYPFTRGIHPDMYRGRYWTRREVCGFGSPKDTNKRIKYLIGEGQGGVNVIFDIPTMTGLDADHPMVKNEVGVQGASVSTVQCMRELFDGIPIGDLSVSLIITSSASSVLLSFYLALAEARRVPLARLRGTTQNDPIHHRYCGYPPNFAPIDLGLRTGVDIIEFCAKKMPLWYPTNINAYDLREAGIGAADEIAFSFAQARAYITEALSRGLKIDEFAPRFAFYVSAHMDLFEEVAKIRAMRRMWARMMREDYGAKVPNSWKFKFGVHTAGCSLVPQQPLNNVIRVSYEALAAVLGGAQSLHCCSFDEPISLPTEESHRIALRTQQILAYEAGVANVADPLGGSYYVEDLTDRVEEKARTIMAKIEGMGGMIEAVRTGWIDRRLDEAGLKYQREVEAGERVIVGSNAFTVPEEEDVHPPAHKIPAHSVKQQAARVTAYKKTRRMGPVRDGIRDLYKATRETKENLLPYILKAVKAGATLGECMGSMRLAYEETYDPLKRIESPF